MSNPGAERPVFCVLSDEQRAEFEQNIARDLPASIRLEFESSPDDALDKLSALDPCLVIVGMTIEPMEGLEFLAMLMARYPNFHEKVLVLPEQRDPFPPMLQYRDRTTGRSTPEEIETEGIAALIRSIAAPHLESQQLEKPSAATPLAAVPKPPPAVSKASAATATPATAAKSPAFTPAAKRQPAPFVTSPKAVEPPSGVQEVAPSVQLKPSPVRSVLGAKLPDAPASPEKPALNSPLANLVLNASLPPSDAKHTGADALAATMLQGPPVAPTAAAGAQRVAAPRVPKAGSPAAPPAGAGGQLLAPPPMRPAAEPPTAAAAPPPPMVAPSAQGLTPPPRLGVDPKANTAPTPGVAAPAAAPAPAQAGQALAPAPTSLLDKLPLGPLNNLPPEKRWVAWAALATPVVMLILLVVVLVFVMGGSSEPAETSSRADTPAESEPAKAKSPENGKGQASKPAEDMPARATATSPAKKDEAKQSPTETSGDLSDRVTVPFAFERGEHDFTITDQAELDELVATIRAAVESNPDIRVEVGGHTSEEGSKYFNKLLGRQRADRVTAYLMKRGVPIERITIKNYQSSIPAEATDGAPSNRRVTVRLR